MAKQDIIKERIKQYCLNFFPIKLEEHYYNQGKKQWKSNYKDTNLSNFNVRSNPVHIGMYNPTQNIYRMVLDIDGKDLQQSYQINKAINNIIPIKFFDKYSGNRGIHKIVDVEICSELSCIMKQNNINNVNEYAKCIINRIYKELLKSGITGITICVEKAKTDKSLVYLDINLHNSNHLCRALYSTHPKTGLFSIPIAGFSCDDILKYSEYQNIQHTFDISCEIPKLTSYNFIDTCFHVHKNKIYLKDINISNYSKDIKVIMSYLNDTDKLCLKRCLNEIKCGHYLRLWATSYLKSEGFSDNEIIGLWQNVLDKNTLHHFIVEEIQALKMSLQKPYTISCKKMQQSGLCVNGCTGKL